MTPGYPSKIDSPRADLSDKVPHIPSLTISWRDAQPLIGALNGHGASGEQVSRTNWAGALNTSYSIGPAPGMTLSPSNVMRDSITWIWDTIGIINGTHADEVLIIGNHRDSWIIGGAADPYSGPQLLSSLPNRSVGSFLKGGNHAAP